MPGHRPLSISACWWSWWCARGACLASRSAGAPDMRTLGPFWLAVLLLPPIVALAVLEPFGQRMVALVGIYALMGLGYQLVFGQLGALNLAQGALFGVGAYAVAVAAPALGALALPFAVLAAAIPAAIVAAATPRLQSHYFALATLALASIVNLVAFHAEGLTGGANGLAGLPAPPPPRPPSAAKCRRVPARRTPCYPPP